MITTKGTADLKIAIWLHWDRRSHSGIYNSKFTEPTQHMRGSNSI